MTDYPGYVFGAVVAAGGAMGYVKKRSVPSLVAGLAFGGLAMAGAYHVIDLYSWLKLIGQNTWQTLCSINFHISLIISITYSSYLISSFDTVHRLVKT